VLGIRFDGGSVPTVPVLGWLLLPIQLGALATTASMALGWVAPRVAFWARSKAMRPLVAELRNALKAGSEKPDVQDPTADESATSSSVKILMQGVDEGDRHRKKLYGHIDLRRNALDCCWSNFKMMFAEGHVAANDQRDIARFYRDYVRMIDAVDAAAPGGILKVRYEELVDDVEGQVRRILEFLGLEWEPACIDFHLATEAVATPSSEQVRRPINRDSIGSADPYRQWLGPMIEELGELEG
jgi:hypothetical protein